MRLDLKAHDNEELQTAVAAFVCKLLEQLPSLQTLQLDIGVWVALRPSVLNCIQDHKRLVRTSLRSSYILSSEDSGFPKSPVLGGPCDTLVVPSAGYNCERSEDSQNQAWKLLHEMGIVVERLLVSQYRYRQVIGWSQLNFQGLVSLTTETAFPSVGENTKGSLDDFFQRHPKLLKLNIRFPAQELRARWAEFPPMGAVLHMFNEKISAWEVSWAGFRRASSNHPFECKSMSIFIRENAWAKEGLDVISYEYPTLDSLVIRPQVRRDGTAKFLEKSVRTLRILCVHLSYCARIG